MFRLNRPIFKVILRLPFAPAWARTMYTFSDFPDRLLDLFSPKSTINSSGVPVTRQKLAVGFDSQSLGQGDERVRKWGVVFVVMRGLQLFDSDFTKLHHKRSLPFDAMDLKSDEAFGVRGIDVFAGDVIDQVPVEPRTHARTLGHDAE